VVPAEHRANRNDEASRRIAWIDIENPIPAELDTLMKQRDIPDWVIDRVLDFEAGYEICEFDKGMYFGFPAPMSWRGGSQSSIGVVLLADAIITVRNFSYETFEAWLHPRHTSRKVPTHTIPGLLNWLLVGLLSGDAETFYALRKQSELAELQMQEEDYRIEALNIEELTSAANQLLVVIYDAVVTVQAVQVRGQGMFDFDAHRLLFQSGIESLRTLREGIEMLLRRLEHIKQQHSINLQRKTDHRIRLLTVFSVIFMPPTLITGIYGMNLQNIPGLAEPAAYVAVFALMSGIAVGMMLLFYKRGWFS
jgi:magnesium transporter